jgi:hypothetical protein
MILFIHGNRILMLGRRLLPVLGHLVVSVVLKVRRALGFKPVGVKKLEVEARTMPRRTAGLRACTALDLVLKART